MSYTLKCSGCGAPIDPNELIGSIARCSFCGSTNYIGDVSVNSNFEISGRTLVHYSGSALNVVIPDSVTKIGERAFADSGIESVIIPESVIQIDNYAFLDCKWLTSVVIPGSVRCIGNRAFLGCEALMNITMPENVSLGIDVFLDTGYLNEKERREKEEYAKLQIRLGSCPYCGSRLNKAKNRCRVCGKYI